MPETRGQVKRRMRKIVTYRLDGHMLDFLPVDNMPGFSHRVIIDGKPADWLSNEFKPNGDSALYFYEKHKIISFEKGE